MAGTPQQVSRGRAPREDRLIFVITGMDVYPFDRLAKASDELDSSGALEEDFFIQLGSCGHIPLHSRFERFLGFDEVCENIRRASAVVTHAGAGSTLLCIQLGKVPVLVPRRPEFGEIVDEHQFAFAEKLGRQGLARLVHSMDELESSIRSVRGTLLPASATNPAEELTAWLESFWKGATRK